MSALNIPISEAIIHQMRPLFSTEEAITQWFQKQMTEQARKLLSKSEKRKAQEAYVHDSLSRAFDEIENAKTTGRKLQSADSLLEEMKQW